VRWGDCASVFLEYIIGVCLTLLSAWRGICVVLCEMLFAKFSFLSPCLFFYLILNKERVLMLFFSPPSLVCISTGVFRGWGRGSGSFFPLVIRGPPTLPSDICLSAHRLSFFVSDKCVSETKKHTFAANVIFIG
jgi:hypothetical protein